MGLRDSLIKTHYCRNKAAIREDRSQDLTHNAIRYTAGYVPRALKKKLVKSCHKNKKDLLLCLDDLISCDGEDPGPSTEWICAIDRGGLTHINNVTFELFLTMEYCIRNLVLAGSEYRDVQAQLKQNDDILFCWSVLTASWSDDIATTILDMIIDLWIVIRGFSMASAWVEHYTR